MDLTDDQWLQIKPLFSHYRPVRSYRRAGRPRVPPRPLLDGVFWKLRSARPWYDLPPAYPAWQTCYARWHAWRASGLLDSVYLALHLDLRLRGGLDLSPHLPLGAMAFLRFGPAPFLQIDPRWETAWELSTALLLFAVVAGKIRPPAAFGKLV